MAERIGTWPVLAAATFLVTGAVAMITSRQPVPAAVGVILLGLAVAPVYPLLVLTTPERTAAASVDRLVGFQAAASTLGAVSCAGLAGVALGVDVTSFGFGVLTLAVLTGGGIWFLRPGRPAPSASSPQPAAGRR